MRIILTILIILFTVTTYSQENDDIYWTIYDVDTIEEETTTYDTDYISRIRRFHSNLLYVSYWSYYNPYWYSYYYPFYTSYYWWWYSPYKYYSCHSFYNGGYSSYNYSHWYTYRPTYHYSHHHKTHHYAHHKKSNSNKKQVIYKPVKINKSNTHPAYQKPKIINTKSTIRTYPNYEKPKMIKHVSVKPKQPIRTNKIKHVNNKTIRNIQKPKANINSSHKKIQHTKPVMRKTS